MQNKKKKKEKTQQLKGIVTYLCLALFLYYNNLIQTLNYLCTSLARPNYNWSRITKLFLYKEHSREKLLGRQKLKETAQLRQVPVEHSNYRLTCVVVNSDAHKHKQLTKHDKIELY